MTSYNMDQYRRMAVSAGYKYLADIGAPFKVSVHYASPVMRYVMSTCMGIPFKTILVGERPYATDIHPHVSSAMSYNPLKSTPTPSTIGIARDVSCNTDLTYVEVEEWFRDSWTYISSGTLVVNCVVFEKFTSSYSLSEVVPFQRWILALLSISHALSDSKVDIICMGVPAESTVDSIMRSLGKSRSQTRKLRYPNPAIISKKRVGDARSQVHTFGFPSTSAAISTAIHRSRTALPYTEPWPLILPRAMSHQFSAIDDVIRESARMTDLVETAFAGLKMSDKAPELRECQESLARALLEYRNTVLRDIVAHAVEQSPDNPRKMGKSTEWGSKKPWVKSTPSVGTPSMMSVVSEDADGVVQRFADADDNDTEVQQEEEPVKKKVVRKKVVRRVRVVKRSPATVGSDLGKEEVAILGAVQYYISNEYADEGSSLASDIRESVMQSTVYSDRVCSILNIVAEDRLARGIKIAESTGMENGTIHPGAMLPQKIREMVDLGTA